MIYVKTKINDDLEIKVAIYGDEFFCDCPVCGKEVHIEPEDLPANHDFSCNLFCEECGEMINFLSPAPENEVERFFDWVALITKSGYPSSLFTWALRNAPQQFLDTASDVFTDMVPGYHDDLPLGDINGEFERRKRQARHPSNKKQKE
jgi:transcription elongation factor Elf1